MGALLVTFPIRSVFIKRGKADTSKQSIKGQEKYHK